MTEKPLEQAVCARCGTAIDVADCFLISDPEGERTAHLCRTEHIVAWVMRGAEWQFERPWEVDVTDRRATGELVLTRVRSGERIELSFDGPEELREWASAGGFWAAD